MCSASHEKSSGDLQEARTMLIEIQCLSIATLIQRPFYNFIPSALCTFKLCRILRSSIISSLPPGIL
jgi:hypothetical protein